MSDRDPTEPSDEENLPDPELARRRILRELGRGSSHPAFAPDRLRIARLVTRAPIWIVGAVVLWLLAAPLLDKGVSGWNPRDVPGAVIRTLRLLVQAPAWFILAIACGVSASLTVAFTVRASLCSQRAATQGSSGGDLSGSLLLLVLTTVGCGLAGWFLSWSEISLATRLWIAAALFLPSFLLMAWFDLTGRKESGSLLGILWTSLRWVAFSAVTLASVVMISPLSAAFSSWLFARLLALASWAQFGPMQAIVQTIITDRLTTAVGHILSVGMALGLTLYLSTRADAMARGAADEAERVAGSLQGSEADESAPPPPEARSGCLGRLARLLGFGKPDFPNPDGNVEDGREPTLPGEEMIAAMRADAARFKLTFGVEVIAWQPVDPADVRFSPECENDDLAWLFNGRVPSTDQRSLLEAFQYRWSEHVRSIQHAKYGADRESHPDLLVEAEEGAQESDAISACAIFAAVARGQRVLLLTVDEVARDALVVSMRERLEGFGLAPLYRVESLTTEGVTTWCPPTGAPHAPVAGLPPDLCIATVDDYEKVFFSGAFHVDRLLSLLRCLEVVIFEGLDRIGDSGRFRTHLPFLLDKHRLLLRNDNRAMQLVVSSRPIGPAGHLDPVNGRLDILPTVARRRIAQRFFGGDGGLAGRREAGETSERVRHSHLAYLRSRSSGTPAKIRLVTEANAAESIRRWFVKWLIARADRRVTVVSLDSAVSRETIIDRFASSGTKPQCISLEELLADSTRISGCRWLVVDGNPEPVSLMKIERALGASPTCRLVIVGPAGPAERTETREPVKATLPVFPTAESPALFVAHLRSAVPLLRANFPTRREDFARFGLSWNEDRWRSYASALEPHLLEENWSIEIDGTLEDMVRDGGSLWPAAFVRHEPGLKPNPVDLSAPVPASLCLVPIGDRLQAGSADHLIDPRRFATWMTARGLQLGRTDLAYFDPILHRSTRQDFRAMNLRATPMGVVVEAEPVSPDGGNFIVPVRETTISLPPGMAIDGPLNVRAVHTQVFRMRSTHAPCLVRERIVALETVPGEGAGDGKIRRREIQPIEFDVHAGVTMLTIGATLPREDTESLLRARYEGLWQVDERSDSVSERAREHWPELTRAFGFALAEVAPTLAGFAIAYGFRPPRGTPGATIVLVEPAGTQGTVLETITVLLDDETLHTRLVEEFRRALADPSLKARHASHPCDVDHSCAHRDTDQLRELADLLAATSGDSGRAGKGAESHGVIRLDLLSARIEAGTRLPVELPTGGHHWQDPNAKPPHSYSIDFQLPSEAVLKAREEFGWDPSADPSDEALLRRGCVRIISRAGRATCMGPDYARMVEESLPHLVPVARSLVGLARSSGATGARETLGVLASFVQSMRYELQREGHDDGRWRFGVQMPIVTLNDRAGDCDSLALLFLALARAAGLGRTGMIVVEAPDGGHAMAGVTLDRAFEDHFITTSSSSLVIVECTAPWPVGSIAATYQGRYAIVEHV